jgi:hypothetical protein
MAGHAGKNVGQIRFRIDPIEFGGTSQTVDRSSISPASIGSQKQIILSAEGNGANRALGGIVIDLQTAVTRIADQRRPQFELSYLRSRHC